MAHPARYERFREVFGLSPASFDLLICVMACYSAEGRYPTRKECGGIIHTVHATELLGLGYLDISAKRKINAPLVATRRAWREFGWAASRQPEKAAS